jgi:hypothetical protein
MATLLKHTVKPSGGDFTTLDAAMDHLLAAHQDLIAADVYATVEIGGTWSSPDTAAVTIPNLNGDATRYLSIYTTAEARHDGKWDTGAYILAPANTSAITVAAGNLVHMRIDGLQFGPSSTNGNYQSCLYISSVPTATIWVSDCILKQSGDNSNRTPGVFCEDSSATLYLWNSIVYGLGTTDNSFNSAICGYDFTAFNIYSCTIIGGKYGVYAGDSGGTITVKNTYAGGTVTEDFYRGAGTLAKTNCASEDSSADDTGTGETASNCDVGVALGTDTFVNVTAGSQDFHLAADGLSPLMGQGVSTSGESAPLDFTTDIDGDTRDATWDIGADAWVVSAPSGMINDICMIFEC